jgi:hypothetical protein
MHFSSLKGERTVADLVNRLYQVPEAARLGKLRTLEPGKTEDLARRAEAALRQANPQLAQLDKLPPGTAIIVPDVAGLGRTAGVQPAGAVARDIVKDMRQDTAAAQHGMIQGLRKQDQDLIDYIKLLKSDDIAKVLAKEFPTLGQDLGKIGFEAETLLQNIERLLKSADPTAAQLNKDLDDLAKSFA